MPLNRGEFLHRLREATVMCFYRMMLSKAWMRHISVEEVLWKIGTKGAL